MAKIGLKYPVYALLTETGAVASYASGAVLGKAISANLSVETNDVKLYADDVMAESDVSFKGGSLSIGLDDLYDAAKTALLAYIEGATADAVIGSKVLTAAGATSGAYVGVGFYGKVVRSGVTAYRALWIKKVRFSEPKDEMATKGDAVAFGTPVLEGMIFEACDGLWKEEATFSTEAGAIGYLNGLSGISATASNDLSALAIATGTLSPIFAATKYLYSSVQTGDAKITATFAAGTAKVYVDGVYTETLASTVQGATIAVAVGVSKLVQIVVQESGKTAKTYTVMLQRA